MTRLHPRRRLLPPSLLPFLHDCLHGSPILYYREFEIIYRSIDNWEELEARAAKLRSSIAAIELELQASANAEDRSGWWSCLSLRVRRRKWRQGRLAMKKYELGKDYCATLVEWLFLLDLRALYLEQQSAAAASDETTTLSSSSELHLADLPLLPHPLTKAERAYLADQDINFPDAPSDHLPPYPTIRPSFARDCPLLILTQGSCEVRRWDVDVRGRFADEAAEGGEAEAEEEGKVWQCYSKDEPELFFRR